MCSFVHANVTLGSRRLCFPPKEAHDFSRAYFTCGYKCPDYDYENGGNMPNFGMYREWD